jgi:hypothetical protein
MGDIQANNLTQRPLVGHQIGSGSARHRARYAARPNGCRTLIGLSFRRTPLVDEFGSSATAPLPLELGVKVYCLALGVVELTSPDGKMTIAVISAVAEFERDLLIERTQASLTRAKGESKVLGRRRALTEVREAEAMQRLAGGEAVAAVARALKTSRATAMRVRDLSWTKRAAMNSARISSKSVLLLRQGDVGTSCIPPAQAVLSFCAFLLVHLGKFVQPKKGP